MNNAARCYYTIDKCKNGTLWERAGEGGGTVGNRLIGRLFIYGRISNGQNGMWVFDKANRVSSIYITHIDFVYDEYAFDE